MGTPDIDPLDGEAVLACADLAGRAGASGFRIGHTDPDAGPVTWFCTAEYGADEITASGHPDPALAAMALAQRILTGGKCRCGRLVALSVSGALPPPDDATMLDGSDPKALRGAGQCLWMLEGRRWEPGCDAALLTMPAGARGKVPWSDPPG